MMEPVAYGIDFGTTNSSLAVTYDDGSVEVLDVEESNPIMPSLVYLNRDGNRLSGTGALRGFLDAATASTRCRRCSLVDWEGGVGYTPCRQMRPDGHCQDARLLSQVKSVLSDDEFNFTHSWGVDYEVEDLVATVLSNLKRTADRRLSADITRLVLGHPVRFKGAMGSAFERRQSMAEERLRGAAERAGFEDVVLVAEAQAAVALDEIDAGITVCTDFGGGTFDVSVIEVYGSDGQILALDGVDVGGEEFDAKIFDNVIRPAIGLDVEFTRRDGQTRTLPAELRSRLRSLSGLKFLLADGDLTGRLSQLRGGGNDQLLHTIDELLYGGQAWSFYGAIEAAKVALSSVNQTYIDYRRPWLDLELPLSRATFEELIATDLERVRACLEDAIASAEVRPDEVHFVTRTGGSSQIPAFGRLVADLFPGAAIVQRDPYTCVVAGLAEYAGDEWGNE
jgi:hypothetical chaperone protein